MIEPSAQLVENVCDAACPQGPTRDGFGKGVVELGKKDERVVVVCADLAESTRAEWFKNEFPTRYVEVGVAEQNLITVAAGLAAGGKVPFITSYAAFSPGRNYEQIRTTAALNDMPVVVCGMHAGVSVGPDGATHQPLDDIAIMRVMPNMMVLVPADAEEARKATIAAGKSGKPAYIRFGRANSPLFTTKGTPFEIGKAQVLWRPAAGTQPQATVIGCGVLVHNALMAAQQLEAEGVAVTVINSPSVKPFDRETIVREARAAGAVVTVEEHQIAGGLGGVVAETLAQEAPMPIEFIGIHDQFGQSGETAELFAHYKLTANDIVEAVRKVMNRK